MDQTRSSEGTPWACDDMGQVKKRCAKLSGTLAGLFRTMNGLCNNIENPLYGSKGGLQTRLLPAEHTKFKIRFIYIIYL